MAAIGPVNMDASSGNVQMSAEMAKLVVVAGVNNLPSSSSFVLTIPRQEDTSAECPETQVDVAALARAQVGGDGDPRASWCCWWRGDSTLL